MFIPADKMKVLREAAKKGDARAKAILNAQLNRQDYSKDLEDYFKPAQESAPAAPKASIPDMSATNPGSMPDNVSTGNPKLDEFLRGNGIKAGDAEYEDAINDYYMEFPDERPEEAPEQTQLQLQQESMNVSEEVDLTKEIASKIIETIQCCDKISLALMQNDELDATTTKGAMTSVSEIKSALFDCADKVKKIKQSLCKKSDGDEVM